MGGVRMAKCNAEQAKSLAEHMDIDKDGFLSRAEVELVLGGKDDSGWASVMEHVDANADGKISVGEFAEAMTGQMPEEKVNMFIAKFEDPAELEQILGLLDYRQRELNGEDMNAHAK